MAPTRSVVITGASRGLGLASARRLYDEGWTVVAAMLLSHRTGLENLRAVTGAEDSDTRLVGVQLDLTDPASVQAAAESILATVGAPYGLVHNAGISAAGIVEETPLEVWERMFADQHLRPGRVDKGPPPIDACRTSGPNRVDLQPSGRTWDAGYCSLFRG